MDDRILETYRFTFLCYLKVAEKLCELRSGLKWVDEFRRTAKLGRSFEDGRLIERQEKAASKASAFLLHHYSMEYSPEGFEKASERLHAELDVFEGQEAHLWRKLVRVTWGIDSEENLWFYVGPEAQRALMRDNDLALARIVYYARRLRQFDERLPLPYELEMGFRIHQDGLKHMVPFEKR